MAVMSVQATAVAAVNSNTFGGALGKVFDNVDSVVQNAMTSANKVATEAIIRVGDELKLATANAADVYKDILEKTADTVDATARSVLTQLQTMAQEFENATDQKLAEIEGKLPALLTLIPFASQQNRLTGVSPVCQVASKAGVVVVKGIFPGIGAGYKDFDPELILNGKVCKYLSGSTTALTFERLPDVFPVATNINNYQKVAGQLKSFWNDAYFPQVRFHKGESVHKLTLAALPDSPGKATVTWVRDVQGCIRETAVSNYFGLAGSQHVSSADTYFEDFPVFPREGWKVYTPNSAQFQDGFVRGPGLSEAAIIGLAEDRIVLRLTVACHHGKKMGNIGGFVNYTLHKDTVNQVTRTEVVEGLRYGDSKLLQPQTPGERLQRVTLDLNDGTHRELGAQPDNSTSIHVKDAGNGQWQLEAVVPDELK